MTRLVVAIVVGTLASVFAAPSYLMAVHAQTPDGEIAGACGATTPTGEVVDESLMAGQPEGIGMALLASGLAESLPDPPAALQLSRVTLLTGAGTETRDAVGPILFYVESGSVIVHIGGVGEEIAAGSSILVQTQELYHFENPSGAPASMLRLGVAPRDSGTQPIAIFETSSEDQAPEPILLPESHLLVRGEVAPLPPASATLIIACLTVPSPETAARGLSHPGPVGFFVEQGPLGIQGERQLPTGGCMLFQPRAGHDLSAAGAPAVALLFAVIPESQNFWSSEAATMPGIPDGMADGLICGDEGDPE